MTIDQAIAGSSNVLFAVLAAHVLDVASFGLFGVVFLTYTVAQCVVRALVSDPLLVHAVDAAGREHEILGTGAALGLCLGAALLLVSLGVGAADQRLGDALTVLAIAMPLLALQDLGRYLAFATSRPARALVLDVTWLAAGLVSSAAVVIAGQRSLAALITAWAGSGALAGLLAFRGHPLSQVRLRPTWLRYTWASSWRYLVSYVAGQGSNLGVSGGVSTIAGPGAVGAMQGGLLLVRPFMTIQIAAIAATIGGLARPGVTRAASRRLVLRVSAFTAGVALLNAVALQLVPARLSEAVLGDVWAVARPTLLPIGVFVVCIGLGTGARAGLMGRKAITQMMLLDVGLGVTAVPGAAFGASLGGASGAMWACAIAQALATLATWRAFLAVTSDAAHGRVSVRPAAGVRHSRPVLVTSGDR